MNYILKLLLVFFLSISCLQAEDKPLIVGITSYSPPFVMQNANNGVYGFDIEMMNDLCKIMKRTCQYKVMRFSQLLPSVANNTIDAAVSAITITADRAKMTTFSLPYLVSYSRFLTKKSANMPPFSLAVLKDKTIGIESGTIFDTQITQMGIINPKIRLFDREQDELEALSEGTIDFVLTDNPSAEYWDANSAGALMKVGPAYMYGFGLGIAANPLLISEINKALLQYQNSNEFKNNYNRYINQF